MTAVRQDRSDTTLNTYHIRYTKLRIMKYYTKFILRNKNNWKRRRIEFEEKESESFAVSITNVLKAS